VSECSGGWLVGEGGGLCIIKLVHGNSCALLCRSCSSAAQPPDSQSAPYGSQLRTGLSIFHYLLNLTLTSFRDLWQVAARMCESAVLVLLYSLTLASVPFCVGVAKKEGLIPRCAEKFAKADN